ncbi:hypothetical protein BDW71DRAFT_182228 [Aspergillus fruticulosus]
MRKTPVYAVFTRKQLAPYQLLYSRHGRCLNGLGNETQAATTKLARTLQSNSPMVGYFADKITSGLGLPFNRSLGNCEGKLLRTPVLTLTLSGPVL